MILTGNRELPILFSFADATGAKHSVRADCVMSINDDRVSEIVSHPVERGVSVADHVIHKPDRITLELVQTNEPIFENDGFKRARVDLEVVESRFKPQGLLLIHSAIGGAIAKLVGGAAGGPKVYALTTQTPKDRIVALHDELIRAKQDAALCEFTLKGRVYTDFVIVKVSKVDQALRGTRFTLECESIRTVTTAVTDVPFPAPEASHMKPTKTAGPQGKTVDDFAKTLFEKSWGVQGADFVASVI